MGSVIFTPLEAVKDLTQIHSDNWIVGVDVEPGTYIATTVDGASGNFLSITKTVNLLLMKS